MPVELRIEDDDDTMDQEELYEGYAWEAIVLMFNCNPD